MAGRKAGERRLLEEAYRSALNEARKARCRSVSFPLISAGIYGYPKQEALEVAVSCFREFLRENEMELYLVVFDREAVAISEQLYQSVRHYIETYAPESQRERQNLPTEFQQVFGAPEPFAGSKRSLEELLERKEETFSRDAPPPDRRERIYRRGGL